MIDLTPEQKQKDRDNQAALLRAFPHYADRIQFRVTVESVWNKTLKRWESSLATTAVISFAPERAKDPPPEHGQMPMFG